MRHLRISKSITSRDAISLDKYLLDISKLPMITLEEEVVLAEKIKRGDKQALNQLVSGNLRFVVSVAKQYQNQGISLQDLINEGNYGLIKAASKFDETRGFKFISYAVWWIRQSIMQAILEQSRIIRLPLNKINALNKIRKAQGVLEQKLERVPTHSEIASIVELNEQEVSIALNISGWHVSINAPMPGKEDSTFLDVISDPEAARPDDGLIFDSLRFEITKALSVLNEREKNIVVHYYGLAGARTLSLEEIGAHYQLTRERVRQIKEKAIRKLRGQSRNQNLLSFL